MGSELVTKADLKSELKEFAMTVTETILEGMDRGFEKLNHRMDNFEARLTPLERKVSHIEEIVLDMRDDLDAGLKAIDQHAIMLLGHDKRIGRMEKRMT